MVKYLWILVLVAVATAQKMDERGPDILEVKEPIAVEFARSGTPLLTARLDAEIMEHSAPSLVMEGPKIDMPKSTEHVVDIPAPKLHLPGNNLENKDLEINLPSPLLEGPKPIVEEKEVLFRVPQQIFIVPKPKIQHKPIAYQVPHTFRALNTKVNLKKYLFSIPSVSIKPKSSHTA